ncbi:unnamed protein product [Linum trigynum]|uniref:GYF domain-containing protein n=1 Tax=Linum trigynum TaxID=586398 RepID=A0AAV2CEX9_9ROSI
MDGRKLDLPNVDLPSSKPPADHSPNPRVEALVGSGEDKVLGCLQFDSKDQMVMDSSIPLSPQWLYTKPSESKMDVRSPSSVSLGAANDPGQKDTWRLDGSEDKKDWRRIASENETSRRWREEERETGLLGARRDRRKVVDRRADVVAREPAESRPVLPSSERRHDTGNRTAAAHEAPRRENNKWSSRWGPEDKDKEIRIEKKPDLEKEREKDDTTHVDNQASTGSIRIAEREAAESCDKWRPRHRMEVHSSSPSSYRAAPGFGPERARMEGSSTGFAVGRGRSSAVGRSLPIAASPPTASYNTESIIGKPAILTTSFCYPRGKLLDIYRRQKLDPSFGSMPANMEEFPPITEVSCTEPLAFVTPCGEELAVLADILKGKVTSSEVAYNSSRTGKSNKNSSVGLDEYSSEGKFGLENSLLINDSSDTVRDSSLGHENYVLLSSDQDKGGNRQEVEGRGAADSFMADSLRNNGANGINSASSYELKNHVNVDQHNGLVEEGNPILPDDPSSLFPLPSSEKNMGMNGEQSSTPLEELYFCYIDPHGDTQGPFLGADIVMWFEEGYFGTDLPVRLADAPEGTPFQNLGEVLPQLQHKEPYSQSFMEQQSINLANGISEASLLTEENDGQSSSEHTRTRISDTDILSKRPPPDEQSFHDLSVQDEEIVFPGRPGSAGIPPVPSSGSLRVSVTGSNSNPSLANEFTDPGLPKQSDTTTLHPFGLLWSELEGSHARPPLTTDVQRTASFASLSDPTPEKWSNPYRQDSLPSPNIFHDSIVNNRQLPHFEQEHNQVDLAEQLISRQIQQQQQSRLSPHSLLNESLMEHGPTQNLVHHHQQQLMGHSNPDVEHLLALQLQQQRQHQLQQQQHQLQLQQQQKLLQERQISQARQVIVEQLLHGQVPDPVRANNILEQVILEQQLLLEMQQQRGAQHPSSRHFHPSMQQEQQRDLYELLSRAQHGQIQNLEQQFLLRQEQIKARQLAEEQQLLESMWPINENDQFRRSLAANQRTNHSSGLSPFDIYQRQQQMQRQEEQQLNNHLDRTLSFQDRLRQGLFDTAGGGPFERSMSMPHGGASGMNMDAVMMNAMGGHPQNPHHHPGVADDWMESQIQQLQINKKREAAEAKMAAAAQDRSRLWMSDNGMNEDKSRQLLMELLHQKSSHQDAVHMNGTRSFDRTSDLPYNMGGPSHEATLNSSFPIGSYGPSNPRDMADFITGDDQFVNTGGRRFLMNEAPPQVGFSDRSMMRGSSILDVQDGSMAEQARFGGGAGDRIETPITSLSRNSSIGFYDDKVGQKGCFSDEIHMNQLTAGQKGQENFMLRRPPSSRSSSSHEGISELVSESSLRGKGGLPPIDGLNSTNHGSENIVKKDNMMFRRTSSYGDGGEVSEPSFIDMLKSNAKKGPEVAAMQQQQGIGGGGGAVVPSEGMMEGGQGGKGGGKKKGKKGRQIDPALLGFKVTSNRIMMGEIHRLDD